MTEKKSGDVDIVLVGTGIAPLVAANQLALNDKSVLVLNPDLDFFREDSELPLDPLWPKNQESLTLDRVLKNSPDYTLEVLRPDFPGAVEYVPLGEKAGERSEGYRDLEAPYVRSRDRLWVHSKLTDLKPSRSNRLADRWDRLEEIFVELSDKNHRPEELEGILATRKFPGSSARSESAYRGILIPRLCDVDVDRYRRGLLEWVREKLGPERLISSVTQMDLLEKGIRFYSGGALKTVFVNQAILFFWTPQLSQWVFSRSSQKKSLQPIFPKGLRLWEEWTLVSREALDPATVGHFEDMTVWAEVEGQESVNSKEFYRLSVLKVGSQVRLEDRKVSEHRFNWASANTFDALSQLCHDFLKWDKFSLRSMKPRALFEWPKEELSSEVLSWKLFESDHLQAEVVIGVDGPLTDVVDRSRKIAQRFS